MKTLKLTLVLIITLNVAVMQAESAKRNPINYTIILDLSDRVLNPNQMSYDIDQIQIMFSKFKLKAKRNLIITSKDRFVVKIIPQRNSPLNVDYYENKLQLRLDQISIKDKNNRLNQMEGELKDILQKLKKEAIYSNNKSDYAGVDIWAFLNDNKETLTFQNYENTVVILTDGYLDFENNNHVLKKGNHFTNTAFINQLNGPQWKSIAQSQDFGIIPIEIKTNATWIISGIKSKNPNDLLQVSKLKHFWGKWIKESTKTNPLFIHYSTKSQMLSELNSIVN
ncbi:hypothetical protein [Aestuariivivens sediminis]|uniref:hypothetical protein n=1 Tax=Aestuariivivens sediminis TaxID=2913557 RepID=UPI001F59E180|nr:hypothetical protein [Aestuariivivens sediminis]